MALVPDLSSSRKGALLLPGNEAGPSPRSPAAGFVVVPVMPPWLGIAVSGLPVAVVVAAIWEEDGGGPTPFQSPSKLRCAP